MARIYKMTDKIPVKIHDLTVEISPLNYETKSICQNLILNGRHMDAAIEALRASIKSVSGLENADGSEYQLDLVEGKISEACLDELLNVQGSDEMQLIAISLLQGIPKEFVDPATGKPLQGVSFVKDPSAKKPRRLKSTGTSD